MHAKEEHRHKRSKVNEHRSHTMHAVVNAVVIAIALIKTGGMFVDQPAPPFGRVVVPFHTARVEVEYVFLVFPKGSPNAIRFK